MTPAWRNCIELDAAYPRLPIAGPPKAHGQREPGDSLFFLSSGFPFLTDATIMSPTPASGNLFKCAPKPNGSMMNKDLAPLLSAQFRIAPTGRPSVIRNLLPEAPPPCS